MTAFCAYLTLPNFAVLSSTRAGQQKGDSSARMSTASTSFKMAPIMPRIDKILTSSEVNPAKVKISAPSIPVHQATARAQKGNFGSGWRGWHLYFSNLICIRMEHLDKSCRKYDFQQLFTLWSMWIHGTSTDKNFRSGARCANGETRHKPTNCHARANQSIADST